MLNVTNFNLYVYFQEFRSFWPEKGNPISVDTGNFKLTVLR